MVAADISVFGVFAIVFAVGVAVGFAWRAGISKQRRRRTAGF